MEDWEASLKARIEEAEKLIATMGQDKLRLTETLDQKMVYMLNADLHVLWYVLAAS